MGGKAGAPTVFAFLGRTVCRAWVLLLAAWVAVVVVTRLAAPPWAQVIQDREFAFLPGDAPSRRATEMFAKAFPDDHLGSNVVLVVRRDDTAPGSPDRDLKFIEDVLEPGLRGIAASEGGLAGEAPPPEEPLFGGEETAPSPPPARRSIMARIRTPNAPGRGALLISQDQRVLLVVVELTTDFQSRANWPTIAKVENLVADLRRQGKLPPGVGLAVTGSAVIGRDHTEAERQSARATELLTFVLVIGLLVAIYRAPLVALIPLATVFLAVQVARNLLAILAHAGYLTLFAGIEIFLTVLAYGAGVDYCLFLTARCQEELDAGKHPADAVCGALRDVGAALVASALTVMAGIGTMVFARFGKFREAGAAIPLSIGLVLLAALTFSPSLLRLAGRWAFWPRRPRPGGREPEPATAGGWRAFFHPGLLERGWERVGHLLERRPGTAWLVTVAAMAPFAVIAGLFYHHLSYNLVGALPADAPSVIGTRVLQEHFPTGIIGPVNVLLVEPRVDFSTPDGRAMAARVTDQLREHRQELGLADIRSLTTPLGITPAAQRGLAGFNVPESMRREVEERAAVDRYTTDLGERRKTGTRFDLVLEHGPFSKESVAALDRVDGVIRDALPAELREEAQVYLSGPTASVRDLQAVVQQDRTRIEVLVLAGVFVILVLLLRRLVVPVYLLLSVLFSYYATLGVTMAVFWLLDPHGFDGLDWKVAIFLFTILIAVGEDYNIFLMSRVDEEERRHGPVRGVTVALDRTGPIISSCGVIMAGTFASLLGGSLNDMKQLGFALAFGVLLDTFVVRPILVPAFLILLHGGRLRRHGLGLPLRARPTASPPPLSSEAGGRGARAGGL
jgi:putative drug exporter of the RND superfamily